VKSSSEPARRRAVAGRRDRRTGRAWQGRSVPRQRRSRPAGQAGGLVPEAQQLPGFEDGGEEWAFRLPSLWQLVQSPAILRRVAPAPRLADPALPPLFGLWCLLRGGDRRRGIIPSAFRGRSAGAVRQGWPGRDREPPALPRRAGRPQPLEQAPAGAWPWPGPQKPSRPWPGRRLVERSGSSNHEQSQQNAVGNGEGFEEQQLDLRSAS